MPASNAGTAAHPVTDAGKRRVYICVLNWNGAENTIDCMQSLLRLGDAEAHIVVCDNDSRPDDLQTLRAGLLDANPSLREYHAALAPDWPVGPAHPQGITLVHTGGNLGYAGGMNAGIRFAMDQGDASHVWVLNNDTEVHPQALRAMLTRMGADDRIGICGSTLVYHGRRHMVQAWGGASYQAGRGRSAALGAFSEAAAVPSDPQPVESQMAYVVGASMLVSRRFIETVGLMDPSYFLYSEEHDWAHRGQQHGFRLGWAPDSIIYHKHGATIGTHASGGSTLSLFYLYRNKALFASRHHPKLLPSVICWLLWDVIKFGLKGKILKARAALRGVASFRSLRKF